MASVDTSRQIGNLNLNLRVVQGLAAASVVYDLVVGFVSFAAGDGVGTVPYVFRAVTAVVVIAEMERIRRAYNQALQTQKVK